MERVNTLRPQQYGQHFADDIFKYISLKETFGILIQISWSLQLTVN